MTESNYSFSSPPYTNNNIKSSGKNCPNRIVRFISPVPADECVVQVHQQQNNNALELIRAGRNYGGVGNGGGGLNNRAIKMKLLMRADTHKHINVIKDVVDDPKEFKCNYSQVGYLL